MPQYKVMSGVHRCVAAHQAGLTEIRARVDVDEKLGPVVLIALEFMYTTKREIGRWDRRRDFLELVKPFADESTRDTIPEVELMEVPDGVTKYLTKVADVVVNPV